MISGENNITIYEAMGDMSITITIYNGNRDPTRRAFHLRNLQGDDFESKVAHAQQIMNEVAEELYYLTGFGIDKGVLKQSGKKIAEVTYPDYTPACRWHWQFRDAIRIRFIPTYILFGES